jgi:hypothetical protein
MLRKALIFLPFVLIVGCDYELGHARTFKWATVDKYKIQNAVVDDFKNNNPYPAEISKDIDRRVRDRDTLKEQISDLETAGKQKCKASGTQKTDASPKKTIGSPDAMPSEPHIESIEDWNRERRLENSPEYIDCMANVKKDQLIIDLKDKVKALDDMYDAKRKYDDSMKKKLEKTIDAAVAEYAEKNGFELIISNQSNGIVIYSKEKAVLDVTADVIDAVQKSIATNK